MRKSHMILVSAGLLALSSGAVAASPADRSPPATRAELQKMLAEHFAEMDANKDGILTGEEHKAAMERRHAEHFRTADKDGDGKLSQAEFEAMREGRDGQRAGVPRPADARMAKMQQRREARRDAMMDRTETRDQFVSRRLAMFDRVDTNRDGTISTAEHEAARDRIRDRMRDRGSMVPPAPPAN